MDSYQRAHWLTKLNNTIRGMQVSDFDPAIILASFVAACAVFSIFLLVFFCCCKRNDHEDYEYVTGYPAEGLQMEEQKPQVRLPLVSRSPYIDDDE